MDLYVGIMLVFPIDRRSVYWEFNMHPFRSQSFFAEFILHVKIRSVGWELDCRNALVYLSAENFALL